MNEKYEVSFHCYFPAGNITRHRQRLEPSGIGRWVEAYRFTHPDVVSVSVKLWFGRESE